MNLPFTSLPGRLAIILLCAPLAGSGQGRPESRPEIARLWLTLSNAPASARGNSDVSDHASVFHSDGSIRHLVAPRGQHFTAAPGPVNDDESTARRFLHDHALAFGIRSERVGFEPHRQHAGNGRRYLRLQQTFNLK